MMTCNHVTLALYSAIVRYFINLFLIKLPSWKSYDIREAFLILLEGVEFIPIATLHVNNDWLYWYCWISRSYLICSFLAT